MADYSIKQGDRLPTIQAQLTDEDGTAINLTGCTLQFVVRSSETGLLLFKKSATIDTAATGMVSYAWDVGDTDSNGLFNGEFEVTFSDGRKLTSPTKTYISIDIVRELG